MIDLRLIPKLHGRLCFGMRSAVSPAEGKHHGLIVTSRCRRLLTPAEKRASITPDQVRGRLWAKRLKRVFNIDIETCDKCGGDVRIIASIEDPAVISTILAYLDEKWLMAADSLLPDCRASPGASSDLLI